MSIEGKLTAFIDRIRARDRRLGGEMQAERLQEAGLEGVGSARDRFELETIVLRTGRPVLAVSQDEAVLNFNESESEVWRERLQAARGFLLPAIRAVGRIELENNPRYDWVGTGWLVKPEVIVTNRHVAGEFGRGGGDGFIFRSGSNRRDMSASIDFLEEFGRTEERSFRISRILHIEDEDGPDLAFLQVEGDGLAAEINLAASGAAAEQMVAVIGYPARDSRIPDQQLMERIFGDVYDKKRLAPGQIIVSTQGELQHDCSTLGGNSGSVVLDLATGNALGIHFAGRFLEANYAVSAAVLRERLSAVLSGEARRRLVSLPAGPRPAPVHASPAPAVRTPGSAAASAGVAAFTVPLTITIQLGSPQTQQPNAAPAPAHSGDEQDVPVVEGVPQDYRGREGYQEDFLGEDAVVELPTIVRDANQVLEFELEGDTEHLLRYEHFSVVMHRTRRMCFYSAVNIDGKRSRKATRTAWRLDPRIDKDAQIMYECYGNPPKFSRGHMTRREDPVWGTPAQALLGNSDSMHATNATPQMQSFNAPIWLGLEDYALQNARRDKMRISVFTGPVLRSNDPVHYDVKIPRSFWKVIAFIHDETGELTATGYSASQDEHLPEFVFGEYDTWQRSLEWIEEKAGISLGALTQHDALTSATEAPDVPLMSFEQIRLRA